MYEVHLEVDDLIVLDHKKVDAFTSDWNRSLRVIAPFQKRQLNALEAEIRHTLETDPRPNRGKFPWRGHVYTGQLLDSVFNSVKINSSGTVIMSRVGYKAEHGVKIEPPSVLFLNSFQSGTIGKRQENLSQLTDWAYDIITRRTTGKKLRGAAAWSAARRWARNLENYFANEDNYGGYPIIVNKFEDMMGDGRYFRSLCSKLQSHIF